MKNFKNYKMVKSKKNYKKIIVRYHVKITISLLVSTLLISIKKIWNKSFDLKYEEIKYNMILCNKERKVEVNLMSLTIKSLKLKPVKVKKNVNRCFTTNAREKQNGHPVILEYNKKEDSFWAINGTSSKNTKINGIMYENLYVGVQYGSNKKCYAVINDKKEYNKFSELSEEKKKEIFDQFKPMKKKMLQNEDVLKKNFNKKGLKITNKETFEELEERAMNKTNIIQEDKKD